MNNHNYNKVFFYALRTSLVMVATFISYDILVYEEQKWNEINPEHNYLHHLLRLLIKFVFIFFIDFSILYYLVKHNLI